MGWLFVEKEKGKKKERKKGPQVSLKINFVLVRHLSQYLSEMERERRRLKLSPDDHDRLVLNPGTTVSLGAGFYGTFGRLSIHQSQQQQQQQKIQIMLYIMKRGNLMWKTCVGD